MPRQLPARASLEFERKQAKTLLEQLHASDADALARVRAVHPGPRGDAKLADAQLVIAREYGFTSWPRFARYVGELEREAREGPHLQGYDEKHHDEWAKTLLAEFRDQRVWTAHMLAGFVPRFYGMSVAEVFESDVTLDDARLAVAREHRCASWEQLIELDTAERARRARHGVWDRGATPLFRAGGAIREHDFDALAAVVAEHPEILHQGSEDERRGRSLAFSALLDERREPTSEARRITDWLVAQGVDFQPTLNYMLLGAIHSKVEDVQRLLDLGADPQWVPPNGISVLEHAIIRYRNGKAVDLVASRVVPRRALWIAAGLDDVGGMRAFFDRRGKPTDAAYRDRPPLGLLTSANIPALPEPDDVELLMEVAWVALLNDRVNAIGFLIDRGFPIDHMGWGQSMLYFAVADQRVPMVEYLVRRGANLDTKGWRPNAGARETARYQFVHNPDSPAARRILEVCGGGDPDTVLADADAARREPRLMPAVLELLELAGDDAARRGEAEIGTENVFLGMLRGTTDLPAMFLADAGGDLTRLRELVGARLLAAEDRVARGTLPLDAAARATIERAIAAARARRHDSVSPVALFVALVDDAAVARLIASVGANLDSLRTTLRTV